MQRSRLAFAAVMATAGMLATGATFAAPMSNLPPQETQGAVTFRSGGVGELEANAMRHAQANYPLSLQFVKRHEPNDQFLANIPVTIKDHAGATVLETTSDGPFLLAKLPDGKYTVTATDNGKTLTRNVVVAANKPEHVVFAW